MVCCLALVAGRANAQSGDDEGEGHGGAHARRGGEGGHGDHAEGEHGGGGDHEGDQGEADHGDHEGDQGDHHDGQGDDQGQQGDGHDDGVDEHASVRASVWVAVAHRFGLHVEQDEPSALDADTLAELMRHAQTIARIDRFTELATELQQPEIATRASALLAAEAARHEGVLAALTARVGHGVTVEAPTPPASAQGGH